MTDTIKHDSVAILREALDTIKATFWIRGKEATFAHGKAGEYDIDWSEWETVNKAILAELGNTDEWGSSDYLVNPSNGKAKVTGVCSIGALALANVTLYDEPLDPWDYISRRDWQSLKAGAALAAIIVTDNPDVTWDDGVGAIIANWNDYHGRTREEVIEAFEKALKHPLATSTELWRFGFRYPAGSFYSDNVNPIHRYFATEEAAIAFRDSEVGADLFVRVKEDRSNAITIVLEKIEDFALVGAK